MANLISKYLNPQNDVAFKHIFGKGKNKDILISMLNAVLKNQLHQPIQRVQFLKTVQDIDLAVQKQSVVDVLCYDQDGCQYIIEMQVAHKKGFEKRAQYYASKAYIQQALVGHNYHNLKEVIFLAFTNYTLFPKKKRYKSEHITLDRHTQENDLKGISFTFVELPKFAEQCPKDISQLSLEEKFFYYLHSAPSVTDEQLDKLVHHDMVIRKAFYELERFSWTPEELATYEAQEKAIWDRQAEMDYAIEKGLTQGKEEGLKEGEKRGKKELADDLIKAGVSKALIDSLLKPKK